VFPGKHQLVVCSVTVLLGDHSIGKIHVQSFPEKKIVFKNINLTDTLIHALTRLFFLGGRGLLMEEG